RLCRTCNRLEVWTRKMENAAGGHPSGGGPCRTSSVVGAVSSGPVASWLPFDALQDRDAEARRGRKRWIGDKGFDGSVALGRRRRGAVVRRRRTGPRHDRIADADGTLRQDRRAQAAPMHEAREDPFLRQALQVRAGLAEANAEEPDLADLEFLADQMVERRPAGNDVPPRRAVRNRDFVVPFYGLDRFRLDQGDLASGTRPIRVRASGVEVPVSLQAFLRDRADAFDGAHRSLGPIRDVDRGDGSGPRRNVGHKVVKVAFDMIVFYAVSATIASASISTSSCGSTRPATWTSVEAGRMSPKNSAWARPTACQSLMCVRKMRVRMTSSRRAPAFSRAASILRRAKTA